MDLAPLQTFCRVMRATRDKGTQHKKKRDQMKESRSNCSCNAPKRLRTKQDCWDAKQKSPLELLGEAAVSTAAYTATAPAQAPPRIEINKATHINYKKDPLQGK